jgi:transketolase
MNVNPKNYKDKDRDRFILSKGHAGAGVYAVLAESGFFSTELLKTHYKDGSALSGHVSHKNIPGVELSTGSLGHGLSVGVGLAISAKLDKRKNKVIVLLSDGECDEGSNWEAIMFSAHHKLDNLIAIIDYNKLQSLDSIENTLNLEPFVDKWLAFGWNVVEVDGHNIQDISDAYKKASECLNKPTCIIAHTTKGKGVSFFENKVLWHYRSAKGHEYEKAKKELIYKDLK